MNSHLVNNVLSQDIKKEPIRKGFGVGLVKAGEIDNNVVAACADLTESIQMHLFRDKFPERFVEIGVAEQNLVTVGSGMAAMGKIPFVASYAAFCPGRCWEQIRTTIALNDQAVIIVGGHAGLLTGPDGATHQMLEDIAIMRAMPNMVVVVPADSVEAEKATMALAKLGKPAYLRMARDATPVFTTEETPFEIGKAYVVREGSDVSIIATGTMTYESLAAAEKLAKDGINAEVIHVPTVKPLDEETILKSVKKTGLVLSVEEAQMKGGLGGAIAELLSEKMPTKLVRMGVDDKYGQSGEPHELLEHYGLTAKHITFKVHQLVT